MAVLKAIIRASDVKQDGKVNIKIRITHHRKPLYISTDHYIEPVFFDIRTGTIKETHPNYQKLNISLKRLILELEGKLLDLDEVNNVDTGYLKRYLTTASVSKDVFEYMDGIIENMYANDRIKSAQSYETTKMNLKKFYGDKTLTFQAIDYKFLSDFQDNMARIIKGTGGKKDKPGLKVNSIAVMMRNLRAVYNKGVNEGLISLNNYPFRRYRIKTEKPARRNLPAEVIRKMSCVELPNELTLARDVFMLSFYLCAINMVDLYNIKKSDIIIDRLDYRRQKTKQLIGMRIQPEAWEIINKYTQPKDKYLLPFHKDYADHTNFAKKINRDLKRIGRLLGVNRDVTYYFARHSLATIGISIGINQDVIGAMLSHSSGKITTIYTEYSQEVIDSANRKIIDSVLYPAQIHQK